MYLLHLAKSKCGIINVTLSKSITFTGRLSLYEDRIRKTLSIKSEVNLTEVHVLISSCLAFLGAMLVLVFVSGQTGALARPMTQSEFISVQMALNCIAKNDYTGAVARIKPIAAAGVPEAQLMLGTMYQEGRGINKDYPEAMKLFKLAGAQGNLKARLCVGVMYFKGWGVPKDYRQAAQWFIASGNTDPDSQNNLGYLYLKGLGVPKDLDKAFQLFQRAANGGNADAKQALGQMYYSGTTVTKDFGEGRKWFEASAKQKCAQAQYKLGVMSLNGEGAEADSAAAGKWFQLAEPGLVEQAKLGDEEAVADLKELKDKYGSYLLK